MGSTSKDPDSALGHSPSVILSAQSGNSLALARLVSEDGSWIEAHEVEWLVLRGSDAVSCCMLVGHSLSDKVGCLLTLKSSRGSGLALGQSGLQLASKAGSEASTVMSARKCPLFLNVLGTAIELANHHLRQMYPSGADQWIRVRRFHVLREDLTKENGMLTSTGAVDRPRVLARYKHIVEDMFAGDLVEGAVETAGTLLGTLPPSPSPGPSAPRPVALVTPMKAVESALEAGVRPVAESQETGGNDHTDKRQPMSSSGLTEALRSAREMVKSRSGVSTPTRDNAQAASQGRGAEPVGRQAEGSEGRNVKREIMRGDGEEGAVWRGDEEGGSMRSAGNGALMDGGDEVESGLMRAMEEREREAERKLAEAVERERQLLAETTDQTSQTRSSLMPHTPFGESTRGARAHGAEEARKGGVGGGGFGGGGAEKVERMAGEEGGGKGKEVRRGFENWGQMRPQPPAESVAAWISIDAPSARRGFGGGGQSFKKGVENSSRAERGDGLEDVLGGWSSWTDPFGIMCSSAAEHGPGTAGEGGQAVRGGEGDFDQRVWHRLAVQREGAAPLPQTTRSDTQPRSASDSRGRGGEGAGSGSGGHPGSARASSSTARGAAGGMAGGAVDWNVAASRPKDVRGVNGRTRGVIIY